MAPAKKKSKANQDTPEEPRAGLHSPQQTRQGDETDVQPASTDTAAKLEVESPVKVLPQARPSSWYAGGSWRSKASPIAQTSRESILVAQGATSEASEEASRRPSQSVSKSMRGSRKSIPLIAEATRVNAVSDAGDKSRPTFPSEEKPKEGDLDGAVETKSVLEEAPLPPEPAVELDADAKSTDTGNVKTQSAAWFGWWSRPDGYGTDGDRASDSNKRRKVDTEEASNTPLPGTPIPQPVDQATKDVDVPMLEDAANGTSVESTTQSKALQPDKSANKPNATTWFGLWSSAQNEQAQQESAHAQSQQPKPPEITVSAEPAAVENVKKPDEPAKDDTKAENEDQSKSSGWAFWSTDRPKDTASATDGTQKQVGQLAVADTPSQSHPEAAQFNEQQEPQTDKPGLKQANALLRPKRGRDEKAKLSSGEASAVPSPADSQAPTPALSEAPTPIDTPPRSDSEAPAPVERGKRKQTRPNMILPSLRDTFSPAPNPGYFERLAQYLALTLRLPGTQSSLPPQHVFITASPPKVRRAVAIGVHGWFPAPMIRQVLGQPTGSSIRFANYAASSIKAWCAEHQPDVKDVEIEKVALEGEGYIADRVTTLWKLLLNWLSHLRQADFILVAAHSQGVPVAFTLLAKLIQLGCLSPHVRLGVCAMAGINMGPFMEYKSRLWGGTALELFEFNSSSSKVSRAYAESIDACLRHGVRVTFIGSIDDQLVSLESSLYSSLSHPYVSRAVFIDGRLHAPNFLTHLVVFALKLRNLGISDHGLLRELSAPLAGSIAGDGHSRVYDDPAVYRLAVDFALESTDMLAPPSHAASTPPSAANALLATDKSRAREVAAARRASLSGYPPTLVEANKVRRGSVSALIHLPGIAPIIASYEPPAAGGEKNPFYLPWAVRGMLEEEAVKRDSKLLEEVQELVKEFEGWRPSSKVLKDVRWRLEGVRSMLQLGYGVGLMWEE